MKSGIELIAEERREQLEKHGFTVENDAKCYRNNELVKGALFCINPDLFEWPNGWDGHFRSSIILKDPLDQLVVAGAFIAAEIDRIQQARKQQQ